MTDRDVTAIALRRSDAAAALGVSDEIFDRHVRPGLPCVRLGSVIVYPVASLVEWLNRVATSPLDDVEAPR